MEDFKGFYTKTKRKCELHPFNTLISVYAKVTGPAVFAGKFRVGLVNFFQKQDRPSSKKNSQVCSKKIILIKFSLKKNLICKLFCYTTPEMLLFSADESIKLQTPVGPNIIMRLE